MSKGPPVCSGALSCLCACMSLISLRRRGGVGGRKSEKIKDVGFEGDEGRRGEVGEGEREVKGGGGWVGGRVEGRHCYSCPVRSTHSCLPSSTAPPVKRALSGERIHFSVETPHTQSSESCSYATSRYLLPVSPINYSPKYRSQGKETPRMGQQDRAALSQLKRGQIKKEWVVG